MQGRRLRRLIVILIVIIPTASSPTTLVGIWTEKQVTISADSKQTISQNGTITGSQDACKIYEAHNLIFALAGLAEAEQVNVVDHIRSGRELVEQGTDRRLSLDSVIVSAESAVAEVLKARHVSTDPEVPIDLLIAGVIDGKLQMVKVEMSGMAIRGLLSLPMSTRRIAYPESRGHDGTDPNRAIELVGVTDTLSRFQRIFPAWNMGDNISVSRRLVAIEASDTVASRVVGPPISTIIVDKRGARWIEKGACDWDPTKPARR